MSSIGSSNSNNIMCAAFFKEDGERKEYKTKRLAG